MTTEDQKELKRLRLRYREARAYFVRLSVGGATPGPVSSARWDVVNAQHDLAEFIERTAP